MRKIRPAILKQLQENTLLGELDAVPAWVNSLAQAGQKKIKAAWWS